MRITRIGTTGFALAAVVFVIAACSSFTSSPTNTFKTFYEATRKKDTVAMKNTLSKGTVAMVEKAAKADNKSIDDYMKSDSFAKDAPEKMPETRNEKIDGDNATLEIKNEKGDGWDKVPFVKEDGQWKIALDKMMGDMKMDTPSSPTSTP